MTTTKSYSNRDRFRALYRAALMRQLPVMVAIAIVFFLCIALPLLMMVIDGYAIDSAIPRTLRVSGVYVDADQSIVITIIAAAMAVILALFSGSYMHSKRMVDMYHSIPVTRPQMLTANFAASMTTLFVPFFSMVIFSFAFQLIFLSGVFSFGSAYFWYLIQDILGVVLCAAICYLFVMFVSTNVGTVFDTFAIAGILGFSVIFVFNFVGLAWADLTYGADFEPGEYSLLLSPFTFVFYKFILGGAYNSNPNFPVGGTLLFYLICLVLAGVLFFAATACYRRRKSETAEKPQANGLFQTMVKIVAAFGGAAFFYLIFSEQALAARVIAMIFGAVLVGTIAELVLSRGIHHLRRNLKWLVGTGVVCAAAILFISFDVTGYVAKVPAPDTVESVSISYKGRFDYLTQGLPYDQAILLTQPDSIAIVTDAHKLAVERYAELGEDIEYGGYSLLRLEYTLKNGSTLRRYYTSMDKDASILLANLEDKDDFIAALSPLFREEINGQPIAAAVENLVISDSLRSTSNRLNLSLEDTERLLSAIKADMRSESLAEILHPTKQALGYICIDLSSEHIYEDYAYSDIIASFVVVTPEYTQTIALLKEFGAYEKMTATAAVPDRVYIVPERMYIDKVYPIAPDGSSDNLYQNIYAYMRDSNRDMQVVSTDDAAQVKQILAAGRNQMVVRNWEIEPTFLAVFCSGETVIGHLLLRWEDVPPELLKALDQKMTGDLQYTYPADKLPAFIEEISEIEIVVENR